QFLCEPIIALAVHEQAMNPQGVATRYVASQIPCRVEVFAYRCFSGVDIVGVEIAFGPAQVLRTCAETLCQDRFRLFDIRPDLLILSYSVIAQHVPAKMAMRMTMKFERACCAHYLHLAPAYGHLVRAAVANQVLARLMRVRRFRTQRVDAAKRAVMHAARHQKH